MENLDNESRIKLIKETLNKIRPFLQRDGGDVQFDSLENDIVYVTVSGACDGCSLIEETLYNGVETIIMEEVPGIVAVRLSSDKPFINESLNNEK
ncbi:MAG: NifU family protein [Bacilli bacterium]|nr:NifU family protein [Bacilli bacterium]